MKIRNAINMTMINFSLGKPIFLSNHICIMEFSKVHIKGLSRPKLLKLMRGGAVRVSRPENASDAMEMIILPKHTKSILSKFGKGKAHTMQLTQEEMDMNSMEGGSLYGMFKKGLKYGAPVLKQGARAGIAMGSAALAASNPALIPFIPAGAAMLGSMWIQLMKVMVLHRWDNMEIWREITPKITHKITLQIMFKNNHLINED
jgi:hypothetical protein